MDTEAEDKIWKALEDQATILRNIETQLIEVVRLDERVINMGKTMSRFGDTLDEHEKRIHSMELKHAKLPNVNNIETKVNNLKENTNISKGHGDVIMEILKFVSAIVVGALGALVATGLGK